MITSCFVPRKVLDERASVGPRTRRVTTQRTHYYLAKARAYYTVASDNPMTLMRKERRSAEH
eukprot:scaffold1323_cov113-Cylindrotheca_fusiformis.AAC.6